MEKEDLPSERQSGASQSVRQDEFEVLLQEARLLIQTIKENNGDILRLKNRLMAIADSHKEAGTHNHTQTYAESSRRSATATTPSSPNSGSSW